MKTLLAKLTPKKAIGLYVGETGVTVCCVASTPLGPVLTSCHSEACSADQLHEVAGRLLKPLRGRRKRGHPVAVGIPALRAFFSTRPIRSGDKQVPAEVLLHEVLQSPNICIDDMTVEVIRTETGKRQQLASILSCRKKYLAGILEMLSALKVRPFRAEPAPCALLRAAAYHRGAPRRCKTALRIILGESQALLVVTSGRLTVLWRYFSLPAGGEAAALCSAIRSVQTLVGHCGIDSPVDTVMFHGRSDLRTVLEAEAFRHRVGIPLMWSGTPELDDRAAAWGLALGCLGQPDDEAFDLSRTMKPRLPLWEIFPWAEVGVQVALMVCMALFLVWRSRSLDEALVPVRVEIAQRAWLEKAQQPQLQKELKELEQKVEAIRKFAGTRIVWTAYTRDIAERLPATATLVSFNGLCEMELAGTAGAIKPKKSFIVKASALIDEDGATPKEVDWFLTALRDDRLLTRDFPLVTLADIKFFQPNVTAPAMSLFTVVCLPNTAGGAPRPPDAKEKGH